MRQNTVFNRRLFRSPRILITALTLFTFLSVIFFHKNDNSQTAPYSMSNLISQAFFRSKPMLGLVEALETSEKMRKNQLDANIILPPQDDPDRGCIMPKITEYNKIYEENGYREKPKTGVQCALEKDWLIVKNGLITFTSYALDKYCTSNASIKCLISYIERVDDFHQKTGKQSHLDSAVSTSIQLESDFFDASCRTHSNSILRTQHTWRGLLAGIKRNKSVSNQPQPPGKDHKLNVLIFGFDSVSHVNFIKRLPKLYSYIINGLNGIVLDKYNIVGDGTTAALLGILAGKYETELPETRRGKSSAHVDVYPFIWKELMKEKYATLYAEDESNIGTFQYRLNGFKEQPTHHWMRPFQLRAEEDHSKHKKYCLGSTPKINVLTRWVDQFFTTYPADVAKFAFAFHSEYSHGLVEELSLADEPITQWFMQLNNSGLLNNTVLIAMSDHGHRFSFSRSTLQGKYEERMPFFSIILPPWFKKVYPASYRALLINSLDRLTSPFDVHASLLSLTGEMAFGKDIGVQQHTPVNDKVDRGLSLFREIPLDRDCEHASISPHWCACNNWQPVDHREDALARKLSQELVNAINEAVIQSGKDGDCAHLSLASVKRAMKMQPKSAMLSFKSSSDFDGRVPDLTDQTEIDEPTYEVQVETSPGAGLFETTARYRQSTKSFQVLIKDISRVNQYGSASHCVASTHPHLSKFCLCHEKASSIDQGYLKVIMG